MLGRIKSFRKIDVMYCTVKVFNGPNKLLTYAVPEPLQLHAHIGALVQVPLQTRVEKALILEIVPEVSATPYAIRDVQTLDPLSYDPHYYPWIKQVSAYYGIAPWNLYYKIAHAPAAAAAAKKNIATSMLTTEPETEPIVWQLTPEQKTIVAALQPFLTQPDYHPALLHGVTGSGKTAVYQELLKQARHNNLSSIFLLPEVSLAMTLAAILRRSYGTTITVHEYHHAVTPRQKNNMWNDVLEKKPIIIVGVRLPIFIPLANLGLIIVDEEHDAGFQDSSHPRMNVKEAALMRAQQYRIPILLGSATPSLSSWRLAHERSWSFFQLLTRFAGAFPRITHAPITFTKSDALPDQFWISPELRSAIGERMQRSEQTIIFLNRRGLHKFVQCLECSFISGCNACSVSLTLHTHNVLRCHYCGFEQHLPEQCPSCKKPANFLKKGIGTQRLVEIIQTLFPHARVARADIDSKKDQKQWHATVTAMQQKSIDILVGTQIITKGYHFPGVTLVGIIWAESNLSIPFYTATEHTLQQLLQVAGRAGRASADSEVVVQSYIKHPVFSFLSESRYCDFYAYELEQRKQLSYPPFARLSELELRHTDEAQLEKDTQAALHHLRAAISYHKLSITILGPAIPPVSRIKHVSLRKMYLKGGSLQAHLMLFHSIKKTLARHEYSASIFFTPNPLQ